MIKRLFFIILGGIIVIRIGISVKSKLNSFSDNYNYDKAAQLFKHKNYEYDYSFRENGPNIFLSPKSTKVIIDSVIKIRNDGKNQAKHLIAGNFGIATIIQPNNKTEIVLTYPSKEEPGENIIIDIPSTSNFRNMMHPENRKDIQSILGIPLYPGAVCKNFFNYGPSSKAALFQSKDSLVQIVDFYNDMLKKDGWQPMKTDNIKTAVYRKQGSLLLLELSKNKETGGTNIDIIICGE